MAHDKPAPSPGDRGATARHNQGLGRYGEQAAARFLTGCGFTVLEHNVRGRDGEVDLLCRDGGTLVACEVKTRSSLAYGTPHEAVDEAKVARLRRVAEEWARQHQVSHVPIRVDLVAVLRPRTGAARIDHVRALG